MGQDVEAKLVEFPAGVDVAGLRMAVRIFEFERGVKAGGLWVAEGDAMRLRWMVVLAGMALEVEAVASVRKGCVVVVAG